MKLSLIWQNSNDSIDFEVVYNHRLIEYFVQQANHLQTNRFSDHGCVASSVDSLTSQLHSSLCTTNSVMYNLCGTRFDQCNDLLEYLDQKKLNSMHADWVSSQKHTVSIDQLRFCTDPTISQLGWKLHDLYPDDIRVIPLAEAMIKLGYIFPYEEVNMGIHRLESVFRSDTEFKSDLKWQVIENPFLDEMHSNNSRVNLGFSYTYVGRQYYNKWQYWDTDLDCGDHYNYEQLEFAFQLNLDRPQTIEFSKEFLQWCENKQIRPVTTQLPIANIVDLEANLKYYRTMLYNNSKAGNAAQLLIQ